jgi:hypothetical protein
MLIGQPLLLPLVNAMDPKYRPNPQNPNDPASTSEKEAPGKPTRNPIPEGNPSEPPHGGVKPMTPPPNPPRVPAEAPARPKENRNPNSPSPDDRRPKDERKPSDEESVPPNPTLPRYGDKEPGDPRKTDANARRPREESDNASGQSQE